MIQSNAFNYINVLDKALDASNLRETVLTNNIANVDTPGYKRREVDFASLLREELDKTKWESLDQKVDKLNLTRLNATAHYDRAAYGYDYRLDGNNVDIDTENVELASNQIKYNGLINSINQEFTNLKLVMK